MSKFMAGLIGIVLIVAISYGAYTKFANPFSNPYTAHVIFSNANGLKIDSLVRVARPPTRASSPSARPPT
jgi:ABC-type transporter Mla subunit MlaD